MFIILGAILLNIAFFNDRKSVFKCLILVSFSLMLVIRFVSLSNAVENKTELLEKKTIQIEGIVTSVEYTSENFDVYNVKITKSSDKNALGILTRMNVDGGEKLCVGDKLASSVKFSRMDGQYKATHYGDGVYYYCEAVNTALLEEKPSTIYSFSENIRNKIKGAIYSNTSGQEAAVMVALIMGDRNNISDELYSNVKGAGVSHMLVVSGMHLGIICGFLINLLRKTNISAVGSAVCSVTAVFLIAIICLFHISILRAGIVFIIMLIGRLLNRNSDPLNSLGFATFLLVLVYPYLFYNVAFLLSAAATFAVIYPGKILSESVNFASFNKYIGKILENVWNIFVISVSAMICTLPIVARYFGWMTLVSPISNLAVTALISVSLVVGVIAVLVNFTPVLNIFSYGLFWVCEQTASLFIKIVEFIGKHDFGTLDIKKENSIFCLIIAVLFVLTTAIFNKIKRERGGIKDAQREDLENIASVRY